MLHNENDGEFVSKEFQQFFKEHGIYHQTSTPYTPQQNGVVERLNCTIVELAQCMLHQQSLQPRFWVEVINIIVYLKVRNPYRTIDKMTPKEK